MTSKYGMFSERPYVPPEDHAQELTHRDAVGKTIRSRATEKEGKPVDRDHGLNMKTGTIKSGKASVSPVACLARVSLKRERKRLPYCTPHTGKRCHLLEAASKQ